MSRYTHSFPFDRRVDRLEESLQILKPLLNGERVDFEGTHYQVKDCVIRPLGPRPDGIPLLMGALLSSYIKRPKC